MVQDDGLPGPDGVGMRFDDERSLTPGSRSSRRWPPGGIEELVDRFVGLRERAGAASAGRTVMTLLYAIAPGADSIDDGDVRRSEPRSTVAGGSGTTMVPRARPRPRPVLAAAREYIDLVE
jgi:hypothetical protein